MSGSVKSRRIAVGIDLGTTNSAMAWADFSPGQAQIRPHIHEIQQLVALGERQNRAMLASALYLNSDCEFNSESIDLPWHSDDAPILGELARRLGPRVPTRYVVSAKSWLCHDRVDRTAPILPWGAPPDAQKISPVHASFRILQHLRQSWKYSSGEPDLAELPLVLTVPASFDESARRLTVEAARLAGIDRSLLLLEEPQAAFYAWIADHPNQWQAQLRAGETILVCDVGGGTTDFTLIAAIETEDGPGFERVAVGDHLMLGGDNMDLALAHMVEHRLGQRLTVDQWTSLRAQSRTGKEKMLGLEAPESVQIGITGKGSRVVGGSMSATLQRSEVLNAILDGFFPECRLDAKPIESGRAGFQEFGLPFEQDPSITKHLASFLARMSPDQLPSAILFNGGALKPAIIRERITEMIRSWLGEAGRDPKSLRVLDNPDLDLAVARGAAYYAAVRQGGAGLRVRSGLARSLYVGFSGGKTPELNWLCVVPQNAQEGDPYAIDTPELQLLAGRKVAFPLSTSSIRPQDEVGQRLSIDAKGLKALPPLEAEIRVGRKAKAEQIPVRLEAQVNAIGTVDLWCVSQNDPRRWVLEIGMRNSLEDSNGEREQTELAGSVNQPEKSGILDSTVLQKAEEAILTAFSETKVDADGGPQRLVKHLEEIFDSERLQWPASACRHLFDVLRQCSDSRRKSASHEARWLNLLGFALRPGVGQPGDDQRIKFAWSIFGNQPAFAKENQVWVEWWILWRRVAPGLNRAQQEEVWRRLQPFILVTAKKTNRKVSSQELMEMIRTAASMERLNPQMKMQIGQSLIEKLTKERDQAATLLWGLGRVASRQPLYGPVSGLLPAATVEPWMSAILRFEPLTKRESASMKLALLMAARKENDRSLDLSHELRQKVADKLLEMELAPDEIQAVMEYQPLGLSVSEQALGESLPIGLVLADSNVDG